MQGARFGPTVIGFALIACSTRADTKLAATPSTGLHEDVAGSDGDGTPDPDAIPPAGAVASGGNQRLRSFEEAKRALRQIYDSHRTDLYCGCAFAPEAGHGLRVDLTSCGYVVARDAARAGRIEWEHAVAAARFGHTFTEWTIGDDRCVDRRGKRFKGRKCAEKSAEFARMEADLHNLFPVVGEVNGLRGDLPMGILDTPDRARRRPSTETFRFGACQSTIESGVFQPRPEVRGDVARAALYMDDAYPARKLLDEPHRQLFMRWSSADPPDAWERKRNRAINDRQGNTNRFISDAADTKRTP